MPGPNRLRVSGGPLEAALNPRHPSGGMLRWRQATRGSGGLWEWMGQGPRWVSKLVAQIGTGHLFEIGTGHLFDDLLADRGLVEYWK